MLTTLSSFLLNHFINWVPWAMHEPEKPESALCLSQSISIQLTNKSAEKQIDSTLTFCGGAL